MSYRYQTAIRSDHDIITDSHLSLIKDTQIKITYKILTDMDIKTEVTPEAVIYHKSFTHRPQQTT